MARASFDETTKVWLRSTSELNVVMAFQDQPDGERVMRVCSQAHLLIGKERVRTSCWEIGHLTDSAIFSSAVQAAAEADMVVALLRAADKPPAALCAWIEAWLLRRERDGGALVALIDVEKGADLQAARTREYLRLAAVSGHMEFLPDEQKVLASVDDPLAGQMAKEVGFATEAICAMRQHDDNAFPHWGINE